MKLINNRICKTGAGLAFAATLTLLGGCASTMDAPDNDNFYAADGTFDVEAAKQAYYDMFDHFGYPIPERLRGEDFWAIDFGVGQFTEVGMAGIFWINNMDHDYLGHEIYLLPGQMIPEHWHVATPAARPKVEGWHLRYGSVTLLSEGEETNEFVIPPLHEKIAVARHATALKPGEVGYLANPLEKHWMIAGPEGAIVSEYASCHDNDGLRFSHPDVKF
jgi:D-lyxose ketol-isomerase